MRQWVIFAALACIVLGMAYGINASHAPTYLVVTAQGSETNDSFCYGDSARGTVTTGILMDTAPEAMPHTNVIRDGTHANEATYRMADNGVNTVSASPVVPVDGPGGGTDAPDAVDYAADNGIVCIGIAVDYEYGGEWSVRDPPMYGNLVVFDTATNDTTNRLEANAGEPVSVWLWWHDMDSNSTDLNLLVSNGTYYHAGVTADPRRGDSTMPVESVAFVPPSDGGWEISVGITGTAVPDRIQLFVGGINGSLEHHAGKSAYNSGLGAVPDHTAVELVITTHYPPCTAMFLNHINVTRLTDVRPHWSWDTGLVGYSDEEYERGINVTAVVWPRDADETMSAIADRPEVLGVAAYPHGTQNAAGPSTLLALVANPDPESYSGGVPVCRPVSQEVLDLVMGGLGWAGAGPDAEPAASRAGASSEPAAQPVTSQADLALDSIVWSERYVKSGVYYYGDFLGVSVVTDVVNATWAYMRENGALVTGVLGENDPRDTVGLVDGYAPLSLIFPLWEREEVVNVRTLHQPLGGNTLDCHPC